MALQFKSTKHAIEHINLMVYGEAGVGKTTLCSTAPSPLIISAEAGLMSLAHLDIPVLEIKRRADIDEIYDWLKLSKDAKKFKTVCLDSLSEIAEVLLYEERQINKDGRAAYGVMADEMNLMTRGFRDLPYHVVFTSKLKKSVEEATGVITQIPLIPGQQFSNNMPYLFDILVKMDYFRHGKENYRGLFTQGDRRFVAKDRSGALLPIEQPNLTKLFAKILTSQSDIQTQETENANSTTESK